MTRKVTRKKFRWAEFGESTNTTTDKNAKSLSAESSNNNKKLPAKKSTFSDYIKKINKGVKIEKSKPRVIKKSRSHVQDTTASGHQKWAALRQRVIDENIKHTEEITEWVDVPQGMEVTEGGISKKQSKLEKAEGFKGGARKVTKTVRVQPYVIDFFNNKKIRIDKAGKFSEAIEVDHVVPSSRFETARILTQKTFHDRKNLVITTADKNRVAKGSKGLHEFVPSNAGAYARKYDQTLLRNNALMTASESAAVWKHTGEAPKSTIMKNPAAPTFEDLATQQARHDRMRGIQRNR